MWVVCCGAHDEVHAYHAVFCTYRDQLPISRLFIRNPRPPYHLCAMPNDPIFVRRWYRKAAVFCFHVSFLLVYNGILNFWFTRVILNLLVNGAKFGNTLWAPPTKLRRSTTA